MNRLTKEHQNEYYDDNDNDYKDDDGEEQEDENELETSNIVMKIRTKLLLLMMMMMMMMTTTIMMTATMRNFSYSADETVTPIVTLPCRDQWRSAGKVCPELRSGVAYFWRYSQECIQ